jgi:hypothetical protein
MDEMALLRHQMTKACIQQAKIQREGSTKEKTQHWLADSAGATASGGYRGL